MVVVIILLQKAPNYRGLILVQLAAEHQMLGEAGYKLNIETMETPVWAVVYYENYNYPEFHGQDDSWNYLIHQTDVVPFGTTHPLNEDGPLAKQIAIQGP